MVTTFRTGFAPALSASCAVSPAVQEKKSDKSTNRIIVNKSGAEFCFLLQ
jgi:hypothetical protein